MLYLIHEAFSATFYRSPVVLWCLPAKPVPGAKELIEVVGRHELVQIERRVRRGKSRRQFPGNSGQAFELGILRRYGGRQCARKGKQGGAHDAGMSKKSARHPQSM